MLFISMFNYYLNILFAQTAIIPVPPKPVMSITHCEKSFGFLYNGITPHITTPAKVSFAKS